MPFDETKAQQAIDFIQYLTHTKGRWAGLKFHLLDWQESLVRELFGRVKDNGYRQYGTCYCEIPKKNGKSELGAAIALKLLCADGEQGGEVYSAAADRDQASIVFHVAAQMVHNSPVLDKRLRVIDSQKRIVDYKTGSFYRVLSSDVAAKHGFNANGIIFDELHTQPNRDLWDVLTLGSGSARTQQLIFAITTAGFDRNSICWEQHDYALKIINGIIEDPTFLSLIYGVPEDANWEDEKEWIKANPSLGQILEIEDLRNDYKRAKETPALQNSFRRLRLNQWTSQETRWISIDNWDSCNEGIDIDSLRGKIFYGGLDLSSTIDIAAYVLIFPPKNEGDYKILPFFFIPQDNIEKRVKKDRVPYDVWVQKGLMIATPGNVIDYNFIEHKIKETAELYQLKEIAYDRWGAIKLVQDLTEEGLTMVPIGQGFASLSHPTKELEKLILGQKIRHGGNPVLRWMADNVMVKQDPAGNIKPDKSKSREKIDGIVATIMALDRALRHTDSTSIYETGGLKTVEEKKESEENKENEDKIEEKDIPKQNTALQCPRCGANLSPDKNYCLSCGRINREYAQV